MTTTALNVLSVFQGPGHFINFWKWVCALLKVTEQCAPRMYHKDAVILQLDVFSCQQKKRYMAFLMRYSFPVILWSIATASGWCFFILKYYFLLYKYTIGSHSNTTLFSGPAIITPLFYRMIKTITEMLSSLKAVSHFLNQVSKSTTYMCYLRKNKKVTTLILKAEFIVLG